MLNDTRSWDATALNTPSGQDYDELMSEQYRHVHFKLFSRWTNFSGAQTILKTDLFAEARCPQRAFLWDIFKINSQVTAIDISPVICAGAKKTAADYFNNDVPAIFTCDVRELPFADGSFDLIVSDSTLDHYQDRKDITKALLELTRVLKPGGALLITMDNKNNITEPFFRLWIRLGLAPFYIGTTYSIKELRQALEKTGLHIEDSTAIMHNPRFFTKKAVILIRRLRGSNGSPFIRKMLSSLDSLEKRKTKFLTAQFIAVKAVKPAR
jgi:SAM-dependent methyltransferase